MTNSIIKFPLVLYLERFLIDGHIFKKHSILFRGSRSTPSHFMRHKPETSAGLMGYLDSILALPFFTFQEKRIEG